MADDRIIQPGDIGVIREENLGRRALVELNQPALTADGHGERIDDLLRLGDLVRELVAVGLQAEIQNGPEILGRADHAFGAYHNIFRSFIVRRFRRK